jgi:hypothetical protein
VNFSMLAIPMRQNTAKFNLVMFVGGFLGNTDMTINRLLMLRVALAS